MDTVPCINMSSQYEVRPQSRYVSTGEAALILNTTVQEVDRYIRIGLLDRYRLRERYVRVKRSQVEELAALPPDLLRLA